MVTVRSNDNASARIPALGLRAIVLLLASILIMFADSRADHLSAVRTAIGAAVYGVPAFLYWCGVAIGWPQM